MNLRLKLLCVFALAGTLAMTFFGYIAYDTAKLTSVKNEASLLESISARIARNVSLNFINTQQWQQHTAFENGAKPGDQISLVVKAKSGEVLSKSITNELEDVVNAIEKNIRKSASDSDEIKSGSISLSDSVYVWAIDVIPESENHIILIKQAQTSRAHAFFTEMGVSLIIVAIIILWVASWAAMYISMLFEKLDESKNILRHRALHDELTGLPNRALMNDRIEQLVRSNDRKKINFAICFIDLNGFKYVNDSLGHHVGDELLKVVSARLKGSLRKSDSVARLGGDEFCLILRDVDKDKARMIAEKTLMAIEEPVEISNHKLITSGSMGIALFPEHGEDVQALLKKADVAMYAAKQADTRYGFYDHESDMFADDKIMLTHDLREAINNDELELYYQAKYDISKNIVTGAEALLRWHHKEHGFVPPPTIIQIAEQSGLIRPLTKWVLKKAFTDHKIISKDYVDMSFSVNLSAHNLQDPAFETDLLLLENELGVDANKITLELTESAVVFNPIKTKELLTRLTSRGFSISVDDFGTGYSTLTNLRRLPISEIKVDRSFVDNITNDAEDASIVSAMVNLAKALDMDVVAEGVENQAVLDELRRYGCEIIQGYFVCKPIPFGDFVSWIKTEGNSEQPQSVAL